MKLDMKEAKKISLTPSLLLVMAVLLWHFCIHDNLCRDCAVLLLLLPGRLPSPLSAAA